jgi:hypothetical protein
MKTYKFLAVPSVPWWQCVCRTVAQKVLGRIVIAEILWDSLRRHPRRRETEPAITLRMSFFFLAKQPISGLCPLFEVYMQHSITETHTAGRAAVDEWSACRRDLCLTVHITHKRDTHPCFWRDSNPQFQSASGCRPKPSTARLLKSARIRNIYARTKCLLRVVKF